MKNTFTGPIDTQGLKQSYGSYYYPNRFFRYEGEYVDNRKHGLGRLIMRDGSYYEGEFKNGEIEGKGVLELSTGLRYEGKFSKGERHGFGVLTKPNYKFEGNFKEGRRHGLFTELDEAKDKYTKGEYQDDILTGKVETYRLSSGELLFKGFVHDGKKEGEGEIYDENFYYKGMFVADEIHGLGYIEDKSSLICYNGQFVNNKPAIVANKLSYSIYLNKENKKGEIEQEEIKLTNQVKFEPGKLYTVAIKVLYQGPDYKNPNYDDSIQNTKKKNNIPEFLTPEPMLMNQESGRVFKYKIMQKSDENVAYECDFYNEYLKANELNYQLDVENLDSLSKNAFSTSEGSLEFKIVFPNNLRGGAYILSIYNDFGKDSVLGFTKMEDIVVAFDLISKFGGKNK